MTLTPSHVEMQQQSMAQPVTDANPYNWVDRHAPSALRPYLRLARLDRPAGFWLLLHPCWWSLCLADVSLLKPYPNLFYAALFALGALLMRGAGCAYNDYVDRNVDGFVARTASRPIPSGDVSPPEALAFAAILAFLAALVLVQFNRFTVVLSIASLALVGIYPFAKRFTHWPQVVLGLAFSWGAMVGWAAEKGTLGYAPLALYAGTVLWTIGYDTIYALQDTEGDALIGLKSTALRFGEATPTWVGAAYAGALVCWTVAGFLAGTHLIFFASIALVALQMAWQVTTLDINNPTNALRRFRANRDVGAGLTIGLVADMAMSSLSGLA